VIKAIETFLKDCGNAKLLEVAGYSMRHGFTMLRSERVKEGVVVACAIAVQSAAPSIGRSIQAGAT
jgi:hypothetical protein